MLRTLLINCIIFSFSGIIFGQEVLFLEDFNTCNLSEQWTYTLSGNQNVKWGVGIPANPKAEGLSINGSCMLYIDDDLTGDKTPAFKLRVISDYFDGSNFSNIIFQAQVHFRRDKTEFMRIIIDNGKKEHVIREFKGNNFSGVKFTDFIDMKSDLSFIASDSMRIIIEYDDDNQWGWWAAIDNIKVTGANGGKIILGETFNDCRLPEGWSNEILHGSDNWQYSLFKDGTSIDGTCFAFFNDDALGETAPLSKIRMYSPVFNAAEFASYQLTYDLIFRFYEASEYLQLYVDNGQEWTPVKTYNGDFGGPNVSQSKKDTIDLSSFRADSIRLIWEYNDGGWAWWVGFDNVKITGQGNINDRCDKALPLIPESDCISFDNQVALRDDEFDMLHSGQTGILYYSFTAAEAGSYELLTESGFNDNLELFTGSCENHTLLHRINKDEYGFKGENLFYTAGSGDQFIIRIYGTQAEFGLDRGSGCVRLSKKTDNVAVPYEDICSRATPLMVNAPCHKTVNIKAGIDGPLPATNLRSRADIWFSFTPETDGDYTFFSHADFADVIAVYSGECSQLSELSSDFGGQQTDIKNAVAGQTYFIQITGYFALLEGQVCPEIKMKDLPAVQNTDCMASHTLTINERSTDFINTGAGFSGQRPACAVYIQDDIWFSFVAPDNHEVYIRVKSDFENIVSIYRGSCGNLETVYCEQGVHHCNGYVHIDQLTAGETYFLQIGSKVLHNRHQSGKLNIEILDHEPAWERLNMLVNQECISKGAVILRPEATGGTSPYIFEGQGLDGAVPGNEQYIVQVSDAEGCIAAVLVQTISCLDFGCTLAATKTQSNASCFGLKDGSASVLLTGGLEPYVVKWSDGQEGENVSGLAAGMYAVTATDGSGCAWEDQITIYQPAQIAANPTYTVPLCFGDSTGVISLLAIGGSGAYQYQWSEGSDGAEVSHLTGGNYFVTITDGSGCELIQPLTLEQPDEISISGMVQSNACAGEQMGQILPDIKGGTMPYEVLWNTGSRELNQDSLATGSYILFVTDKNHCTSEKVYEVTQPEAIKLVEDSIRVVFSSLENALIDIHAEGGKPPYEYAWLLDGSLLDVNTEDLSIDVGGIYQVIITDSNGCILEGQAWQISRSTFTSDVVGNGMVIYPNPTHDVITVLFKDKDIISNVQLKDTGGKIVKTIILNSDFREGIVISLSDLPAGNYILSWNSGKRGYTSTVIKIH